MFLVKLLVIFAAICVVQSGKCLVVEECDILNENFVKGDDQQNILNYHNKIRRSVSKGKYFRQPKPKRPLQNLQWDDGLAKLAQKVTETCKLKIVQQSSPDYECVGQNIWYLKTKANNSTLNWKLPVGVWADKVHDFVYPDISVGKPIWEYTQLVSSYTTHVGCAASQFQKDDDSDDLYTYFAVCNYGPCGNKNGRAPYEI